MVIAKVIGVMIRAVKAMFAVILVLIAVVVEIVTVVVVVVLAVVVELTLIINIIISIFHNNNIKYAGLFCASLTFPPPAVCWILSREPHLA